jgi:asparagine synthetase B (glutamine-hydrolysing)
MASADGSCWITYNGEIYNYLELREELRGLGHSFATATDTEVILAAWQQWGAGLPAAVQRHVGLRPVRREPQRPLCARDRFGVKPFHYHAAAGFFAFASEIKGLFAHPAVPAARARARSTTSSSRAPSTVGRDASSTGSAPGRGTASRRPAPRARWHPPLVHPAEVPLGPTPGVGSAGS